MVAYRVREVVACKPGGIGRPVTVDRRRVIDAIFYLTATGRQWRAPPRPTRTGTRSHRYHLQWSCDGTWEAIAARLRDAVRAAEGRNPAPSAGIIDARSVRSAATVTSDTKGYDSGKKISGRKTLGIVDTLGLLVAVIVVAANPSDNTGGIAAVDRARDRVPPGSAGPLAVGLRAVAVGVSDQVGWR